MTTAQSMDNLYDLQPLESPPDVHLKPPQPRRCVCDSLDFTGASSEEITRLLKSFSYETIWPSWWMLVLFGISRGYSYRSNTKPKKNGLMNIGTVGTLNGYQSPVSREIHVSCRLSLVCPKLVVQRNPLVHHPSNHSGVYTVLVLRHSNLALLISTHRSLNRMHFNATNLRTWSWG